MRSGELPSSANNDTAVDPNNAAQGSAEGVLGAAVVEAGLPGLGFALSPRGILVPSISSRHTFVD